MKFCNKAWGMLLVFFCSVLIFAADTGDSDKGKELFERRCKACHGTSGDGNEAIAKMFEVKMRPFNSKEVQSQEDEVLKKVVLEGRGKMQPLGLSEMEANDVVAFLRTLKK